MVIATTSNKRDRLMVSSRSGETIQSLEGDAEEQSSIVQQFSASSLWLIVQQTRNYFGRCHDGEWHAASDKIDHSDCAGVRGRDPNGEPASPSILEASIFVQK